MSVSRTAFHFAPISHGPITAQWTAHKHSHSDPMFGVQQQQQQHYPFPAAGAAQPVRHRRTAAEDEDEAERQLDYETDANTEYNAALLSANARPMQLPPVNGGRDKGKQKSRDKEKEKDRERTRQRKDQERRARRREQGLESDTTQGEDSDDGEFMTGFGSSRRHASAAPAFNKQTPQTQPKHASTSMPNIPPAPTSAHPYISNVYTSPAGQYGYPQQQPQQPPGAGYGAQAQAQPQYGYGYAGAGAGAGVAGGGYTPGSGGGYFSPSAPTSGQFPSLFAQTDPRRQAAEAAARQKLEKNPLPGLPGGGMDARRPSMDGRPGGGVIPGLSGMPGAGRMGRGRDDDPMHGQLGTLPGGYGPPPAREKSKSKAHGKSASTGTMPSHSQSAYARAQKTSDPPPSVPSKSSKGRGRSGDREKEKDRSRSRSQRPGWDTAESLLGQSMHQVPGAPDALRGPPEMHAHGRGGAPDPHGRRDLSDPHGRRDMTDRRDVLDPHGRRDISDPYARRDADPHGLRGVRDGPAILHGGQQATIINGVPVVHSGPTLERVPSRSKWGKIAGLFGRGRRGSAASQNQPEPPPTGSYAPPPPAATTRHKSGLRNLSFDRLRRPTRAPVPPMDAPPQMMMMGDRPDIGLPPGHVPVGIHVDKYGKIIDPPDEFLGGRASKDRERVQGFRPGRGGGADDKVEGPMRIDPVLGRRTSSDVGYARDHMGMGMRRTSSDAPLPGGYGAGAGAGMPPPLGVIRPGMEPGRRPSNDSRRPSLEGPDAYGPPSRHRAGSGSSHVQPPPPLTGMIGSSGFPGYERSPGMGADGPVGFGRGGVPPLGPGGMPPLGHGGMPPLGHGGMPPLGGPGGGMPPPMKSPAALHRQSSWDARSAGMAASLVSPHTPRGAPSPHMHMPSPHLPKGTPRYASDAILSPRPSEMFTGQVEGAGATPYMREREPSIATTVPRTLPRPRTADSTVFGGGGGTVMDPHSPMDTPSPDDVTEADVARAAQHREAFGWAEQEAQDKVKRGDEDAPYIFNGFPTWVNWDLFTRLENQERHSRGQTLLPRVTSSTKPEKLQDIYDEWHETRDKWVDRFWDPTWARFMHETGGPIQRELAEERQMPMGRALEAARVYKRENSELPLAKREFSRGYLWDDGYMHKDWQWIKIKPWRWTVEHENDERRANGRAPLPRHNPGMSQDDWRDVRDVWHTTASKWAEKRKDLEWVERDRREGITPERRYQLEQHFLRSRQQHKVIRKASGQRSREALRPEERDKVRHDSAMEALARRRGAYEQGQAVTPRVTEAELARRRIAQEELDALMRTPATIHPRPASSIGHGSMRRGEGSVRMGGSSVGHAGASRDNFGRPLDGDTSPYDSTTSEDVPPANPYLRAPGGPPPPPSGDPLPDWIRHPKTSDPPSSSMQSGPGRNPSAPLVTKPKKPGIIKGILKRTLSMQRNNPNAPGRNNSQRRNDQPTHNSFGGMFGHGHSRSEVSPVDNPWAGVFRSAHPVAVQPIRFDRSHAFSMTSPHALEYEGNLYPSAIHLWHAMRFLRRPAGRGRGRAEESWHPELAEGIRQASEPELYADQWAHAGAIGKDGSIMRSLQRPDWDEVQMEKMDEVLALKFTQHPSLGKMLLSTHPAQLLYMWDAPWGAGTDLKGPNNLGKAIMRCRVRLMLQQQAR